MLNNISNNMDAMLDALRPQEKEVEGLTGRESILANLEAEADDIKRSEARDVFLAQREAEEIDQDNRIFDAQQ